jgi:hypothetical protein
MNEILAVGIPTLAVLAGILVNNSRMTDQRAHMDKRFDDLRALMDAKFAAAHSDLIRVEQVIDARLKHLEDRSRLS